MFLLAIGPKPLSTIPWSTAESRRSRRSTASTNWTCAPRIWFAPVGSDFDVVSQVTTTGNGTVRIDAVSGASVTASVDWGFVLG